MYDELRTTVERAWDDRSLLQDDTTKAAIREVVLGSNTVITGSTHIIDVTGAEPVEYRGYVPPRSVVIPGSYAKKFPAGEYSVACALIIGRRKESTDKKTSLNDALRDFGVAV